MIVAAPSVAPVIPAAMNTDPRMRFPRTARVRVSAQYMRAFEQGKRLSDPLFGLHHRADADVPARLGMAVSRKVDTRAVVRNRIKRVLRETLRPLLPAMPGGDYVFVARSAAAKAAAPQLRAAIHGLLRRAGALPPPSPGGTMPRPEAACLSSDLPADSAAGRQSFPA